MIKKIISLFLIFMLTGCYDYKELNTISIISASSINKIEGKYVVNVQAVNPQAPDKTATIQAPFIMYEGTGQTIQDAYREITVKSSRFLYPNHLQVLIINEQIAKENISELIDFYLRNPSIRSEFYILLSKDSKTLNTITPIDEISATSIKDSLKINRKYLGTSTIVTFNEFASMLLNPHQELVLPTIEIINESDKEDKLENTEETKVETIHQLGNLAIFKENKLMGYLTKDESITYNIIMNNIENTIITYECEKGKYISTEISSSKTKIKEKNKEINIDVKLSGNITESTCNIDLDKSEEIIIIKKLYQKMIKNKLEKNISNIRNTYNSDVFGFLDIIYKTDYKTYMQVKKTWYEKDYKNIKININTDIDIIANGNTLEVKNEKN